jgi:hypothetical protein
MSTVNLRKLVEVGSKVLAGKKSRDCITKLTKTGFNHTVEASASL